MSDGPAPHRANAVIALRPADAVRGQESGRGPNPGPPLTHRAATLSFSHRRFLPAPRRRAATHPKSTLGTYGFSIPSAVRACNFHVSAISLCVLAALLTPAGLPSDLVIKGVMDEAWLADANAAFDRFATQPERIRLVPEAVLRENGHVWPEGTSPLLKGKPAPGPGQKEGEGAIHRPRMGGLYTLPDGHNAPFRRMIAHPKVVQRLNMMLGPGYHEA